MMPSPHTRTSPRSNRLPATVRLSNKMWTPSEQANDPAAFQNALATWHERHHAGDAPFMACLTCNHPLALLTARRLPPVQTPAGDKPAWYFLARLSGQADHHKPECEHAELYDARPAAVRPGIRETAEGTSIRLELSLSPSKTKRAPSQPKKPDGTTTTKRSQKPTTLLGLLHYLYEISGLTAWDGDLTLSRKWNRALWLIQREITTRQMRVGHTLLTDRFLRITKPENPEIAREARQRAAAIAKTPRQHALALAFFTDLTQISAIADGQGQRSGWGFFPLLRDGSLRLAINKPEAEALLNGLNVKDQPGVAHVGLFQGEITSIRRSDGFTDFSITFASGALMPVHLATLLPIDNPHETGLVTDLVARHRVFDKPLRYPEGPYAPNIMLRDTGPLGWPLHIWAVDDPSYEDRRKAIDLFFQTETPQFDGQPWEWDVITETSGQNPNPRPPLPTP